ncbi:uncharacterized protein NPIL_686041 [Nephila pilipes]|uniref:Uncharacterized protein n=1 Tax=Nephila pilipes TaxID=299642 RepID=A0A8X6QMC2_NEPPI|nr:uncharacterized protein NPIL_686041 [Nephila pilipes]
MASVQNIGINGERIKAENERISPATGMSKETSPSLMSKVHPKESYWFAHSGHGDASPPNVHNDSKSGGDLKDQQIQKDKEEKIRLFRELQEEERLKRVKEMEQQFLQAKKHREQQEEERRRRIEEARIKEFERRQQVEERKRQIWEAEQERKEAILRRNMEREARIEARRNAQKNSQSFAFGSSTPRTFDLDLAAIGMGRSINAGSVLMSSVSRRSEERELGPPRATSACSLDRKFESISNDDHLHYDQPDHLRSTSLEPMPCYLSKQIAMQHKSSNDMKACLSMWDSNVHSHPNFFDYPSSGWLVGSGVLVGEDCMSRSMVSLSSSTFRGRKRTDIMPTLTRERSITPHVTPRGNSCMRAVSMTRLDQLAQPRRTYRDPRSYATGTTTNEGPRTVSPSMSKSMCNLANSSAVNRRAHAPMSTKGSMARSMLHLADSPQKENRGLTPSPTLPKSGMRSAQSMMHLAVAPRLTRAARLRAEALAGSRTVSAWNLNKPESYQTSHYLPPGKDTSRSPSRPQSSMSGTSELSTASSSAVNMRPRTAPRRPRPYSVAGSIVNSSSISAQTVKKEVDRPTRQQERNISASAQKPPRAKSANRESSEVKNMHFTAPKKPAPPPKPLDVLAKAKSHPVPIKDNLRKRGKSANHPIFNDNKDPIEVSGKSLENVTPSETIKPEKNEEIYVKDDLPLADAKPSSAVTSPTTDSEMLISYSDDSKVSAVMGSDMDNTLSQSVTESDNKIEESSMTNMSNSQSVSIADNDSAKEAVQKDSVAQNIPSEAQQKEIKSEISAEMQTSFSDNLPKEAMPSKPRITSEEEARAALAEKRRLAREQAEREAELERQRLEELRRQEEEQKQLEELEQKRMEEEQIRLAALHRQLEEEKLAKAIEEQQRKEKEEQERKEEEARQRAEKEEQERKAREEAEKQRLELEEKLRKEEEERAERKKRVEQIMARTRGKTAAQSPSNPPPDNNFKNLKNVENTTVNSSSFVNEVSKTNIITNGVKDLTAEKSTSLNGSSENQVSNSNSWSFSESKQVSNNNPLPDILNSENIANQSAKSNGTFVVSDEQSAKISVSNSFSLLSNRTLSANEDASPQTNGYSSHEEMSCTTSPEENADMGLLIDIQSNQQQRNSKTMSESTDFTKLVDVDQPSLDNNDLRIVYRKHKTHLLQIFYLSFMMG